MRINPQANDRILTPMSPAYLKRILFFVRKHAVGKICGLIIQEFPDICNEMNKTSLPAFDAEMNFKNFNDIFKGGMPKHNL
ncbi:hypothetical protein [Pseudoramibacter alactolyticus]|uniref:hypothetical protein n=1 Tax=Pseudoramibacter alactolyticus TaxID=113287 RepID=UPI0028EB4553|nr:hypothetical protein [Pseudoramibacter alactolyticus]